MNRRNFLQTGVTSFAALALPFPAHANDTKITIAEPDFVYLSPLHTNGGLARCQAHVWYVTLGHDVYVCMGSNSWHVQAAHKGLRETRLSLGGDFGQYRDVNSQQPSTMNANASVEFDKVTIEAALTRFGNKYASAWDTWGPIFKQGLADGSRSLLKYQLLNQYTGDQITG
jgi:hypothetical protein